MPVDEYTAIQNISFRLAGSRRYGFTSRRLRLSMGQTITQSVEEKREEKRGSGVFLRWIAPCLPAGRFGCGKDSRPSCKGSDRLYPIRGKIVLNPLKAPVY
jgi:hypothetical protein